MISLTIQWRRFLLHHMPLFFDLFWHGGARSRTTLCTSVRTTQHSNARTSHCDLALGLEPTGRTQALNPACYSLRNNSKTSRDIQAVLPPGVCRELVSAVCKHKEAAVCTQRNCRLLQTDTEIAGTETSTLKETAS